MLASAAERALAIAVVSAAFVLLVTGAMIAFGRSPTQRSIRQRAGQAVFAMLLNAAALAIPVLIAAALGVPILAAGVPPIRLLLIALAGLIGFWLAFRGSDYGARGCSRLIGMLVWGYVAAWGAVLVAMSPGLSLPDLPLAARALMPPILTALPLALIVTKFARLGTKRRSGAAALFFVGAWATLCFSAAENAAWAAWLPASNWLRYPVAGAIGTAPVSGLFVLAPLLRQTPRSRWWGSLLIAAAITILGMITGLVWAAASALLAE
ncbi:hypothetical protein [Sphingomonas sp. LM7]|uniref:hypothetical protein n=1 Tax=Sphingomonas sp. LM7 TaxID=1938607 RepID=UPI000983D58D|nr:hypothetical protein [Sphingomonas sp. LM7]AQR73803.1 hypothetical protein BXU08_09215 [Sphingomonas sp. LM7]